MTIIKELFSNRTSNNAGIKFKTIMVQIDKTAKAHAQHRIKITIQQK